VGSWGLQMTVVEFKTLEQQNLDRLTKVIDELCESFAKDDKRIDITSSLSGFNVGAVDQEYVTVRLSISKEITEDHIRRLASQTIHNLSLEEVPVVRYVKYDKVTDADGVSTVNLIIRLKM
jgi:hypothetical protein